VLREQTPKIDLCGKTLSSSEVKQARLHHLSVPEDIVSHDDRIVKERTSPFDGTRLFDVLARPTRTYSSVLRRDVYAYWDMIAGPDLDSGREYLKLLRGSGLLREPPGGLPLRKLDDSWTRNVWSSGVKFEELFDSMIVRKLAAGELIIFNNMTWTHSCSNWTPESGVRRAAAAFA
jgi:hypothetical protein